MEGKPFLVDICLNGVHFVRGPVDSLCLCYGAISERFAETLELPRIKISPRTLDGVVPDQGKIRHITYADLDVHGVQKKRAYFYIIPDMTDDIILGDVWMKEFDAVYSPKKGCMDLTSLEGETIRCWNRAYPSLGPQGIKPLKVKRLEAKEFLDYCETATVISASATMADIEKSLRPKKKIDPKEKLPPQYREWLRVFDRQLADKLPMHRPGVDHKIVLKKDKGTKPLPHGDLSTG